MRKSAHAHTHTRTHARTRPRTPTRNDTRLTYRPLNSAAQPSCDRSSVSLGTAEQSPPDQVHCSSPAASPVPKEGSLLTALCLRGTVTVPIVLAVGIGVASAKSVFAANPPPPVRPAKPMLVQPFVTVVYVCVRALCLSVCACVRVRVRVCVCVCGVWCALMQRPGGQAHRRRCVGQWRYGVWASVSSPWRSSCQSSPLRSWASCSTPLEHDVTDAVQSWYLPSTKSTSRNTPSSTTPPTLSSPGTSPYPN
jgi:hypothetical protein